MTFVSTNASREWVPTCGLCSVAAWRTVSAPSMQRATQTRSETEPTSSVNGPAMRSSPTAARPEALSVRMSASPRWPELPVTSTVILAPIGQNSLCLLGRRVRRINAIGACSSGSGAVQARAKKGDDLRALPRMPRRLGKRPSFATARGSNRPRTEEMAAFARRISLPPNLATRMNEKTRNGEG